MGVSRAGAKSAATKSAATPTEQSKPTKMLVTGTSGHLGANLVRRLLDDGHAIRVLLRPGSDNRAVDGLDVERVYGDLRDRAAVDAAVKGCQRVYHAAAQLSTLYGDAALKRSIYDSNVTGTRHVLGACARHEVERVVVTGSFSAVGYDHENPSRPSTEEMRFYPFERMMPYECSKAFVEHECMIAAARGLDVRVATSCAILGPHDYKPSRMGRALCDFANGKLRAYIDGGFEFVAARDIVEGHVLAMERGRRAEKYVFATEFVTLPELMDMWSEITGQPRPRLKLPAPLMGALAEVMSPLLTRFAPSFPQRLTPGAVRILQLRRHADLTKARTELGYQPTTVRQACQDAYEFFAARGAIRSPVRVAATPATPRPAVVAPVGA
jgi:nucleoside-diphosphate-sugar epimerase